MNVEIFAASAAVERFGMALSAFVNLLLKRKLR
jgi:hypothetical protein